jgi:hypothetical protein
MDSAARRSSNSSKVFPDAGTARDAPRVAICHAPEIGRLAMTAIMAQLGMGGISSAGRPAIHEAGPVASTCGRPRPRPRSSTPGRGWTASATATAWTAKIKFFQTACITDNASAAVLLPGAAQ